MNKYYENFKFEDGILKVHLSGEFPRDLLRKGKNLFQPLVDACATYTCKKVLIDITDLQVDFSTIEMFQAGKDAAELVRFSLRIAVLARKDSLDEFFDNVVFNRGGNFSVFTDMNAAYEWLKK
jgi:hypothetical protein